MRKKGKVPSTGLNGSVHRMEPPMTDQLESREEKVARLKKAVADGTYYVPALDIAERMLAATMW